MILDHDVKHIADLAIGAIRDIAVAVAGAGVGKAIDAETGADIPTETIGTSGAQLEADVAKPARRGPGRPPKNANGQAGPAGAAPAEVAVEATPVIEAAPQEPSLDDLFPDEPEAAEETSKSPDTLRAEIGAMIISLIPRLGTGKTGRDKIVTVLKKHGASAPRDLVTGQLAAVHEELTSMMRSTENPGSRVGI
jgi:hypothetical protein